MVLQILVFNKMDVLREIGEWKFYNNGDSNST